MGLGEEAPRSAQVHAVHDRVSVPALVRQGCSVSLSTIRRDLAFLNGQAAGPHLRRREALDAHPEESPRQRTDEALEQNHAIARWAAA